MQRKKRRALNKGNARAIVGASLEVINKRRTEKPEVRQATRDAALREIKERAKKAKAEKAKTVSCAGRWWWWEGSGGGGGGLRGPVGRGAGGQGGHVVRTVSRDCHTQRLAGWHSVRCACRSCSDVGRGAPLRQQPPNGRGEVWGGMCGVQGQ